MIFESIKFVKQHHGWKTIPGFLFYSCIENLSGIIFVGELKDAIPPVPAKLPVEIRQATPQDSPRFRNIIPPYRINRFVHKMEAGERCIVALLNEEVVYFTWASFAGQYTGSDAPVKLGPKDVYIWGSYCLPEYRRFGLGISVQSYLENFLRDLGYVYRYNMVKANNHASINLCKKLKLRIAGHGYGIRIFNLKIYHCFMDERK